MAHPVRTVNTEPCACPLRNVMHADDCAYARRERELWGLAIDLLMIDVLVDRVRRSEVTP